MCIPDLMAISLKIAHMDSTGLMFTDGLFGFTAEIQSFTTNFFDFTIGFSSFTANILNFTANQTLF